MVDNPFLTNELFVGRDSDLVGLAALLRQGNSALLVGGRRVGKTTLARQLTADQLVRRIVYTDVSGWNLTTEDTALGGLLSELQGRPAPIGGPANRADVLNELETVTPLALILDEADRVLLHHWGPGFYAFLRYLDDFHLRGNIALLLIGGPVLALFRDPDDHGSPPLNTAQTRFIEPLDTDATTTLCETGPIDVDLRSVMDLAGGQAWLTTQLLAELWDGVPIEEAADTVFERSIGTFQVWQHQLGPKGVELVRRLPRAGVSRAQLRAYPWSRHRESARFGRCVGALRFDGDHLVHGPSLFTDWLLSEDTDDLNYDLAISYASEDEPLARQIHIALRNEFKVFFAPEDSGALWGTDLKRVLPNTYGTLSRYVLVLSTQHYVRKHWTRVEYDAVAANAPERILLLDFGELPPDLPNDLVYRGSSPGELVQLVTVLRERLAAHQ
jgi:TIR domain/AAA domain